MQKTIILILGLFFFSYCGLAQYNLDFVANLKEVGGKYDIKTPEKTIGVVIYQQIYHPDSTRLDSLQIDTMALSYSTHFSDYRNNKMRELDSLVSVILLRKSKEDPSEKNTEPFPKYDYRIPKTRFLSTESKVYGYEKLIDNIYLLKYITQKKNWNIEDSTKNILGFNCQKATANILGRHYTAWFTTDIPSAFGPRTLVGLPGMVLQGYDDSGQVFYTAISLFTNNSGDATIGIPSNGMVCSKKEFDDALEVLKTNPRAFLSGQKNVIVGSGSPSRGANSSKKEVKKEIRNAIELKMEN